MMEGFSGIMTLEETAKGMICEQFAYHPYLSVYPNSADMNELYAMPS